MATAIFAIIGIFTVSYVIGFKIVPMVLPTLFKIMDRVARILAYILARNQFSLKILRSVRDYFSDQPVQTTNDCKEQIHPPKQIKKARNFKVYKHIVSRIPFIKQFCDCHDRQGNNNPLNLVKHPVTDVSNKRSFDGASHEPNVSRGNDDVNQKRT